MAKIRRSVALAAVLTGAIALASCSSGTSTTTSSDSASSCAPAGGKVDLTFWNWGTGMDKAVDLWNEKNPDIHVDLKTVPNGNAGTYQNLFNGLKAGTAPDIAPIEYDTVASFRLVNGLKDISGCADVGTSASKFVDWTWSQVSEGKNVFAVPQDIGPLGLYYRKDIFDKYGLAAPTTWQEYYDDAVKLKAADPSYEITHFSQTDPNWFTGLLWQNSAKLFGTQGDKWQVSIDSPQAQEVAAYWQKMIDQKLVSTDLQGFSEALSKAWDTDKVLTWVSAPWGWSTIRDGAPDTSGKWAVAPIPQWKAGDTANGNWGGSSTAVMATSKHPYEAAKFLLWLNSDPEAVAILIKETGIYPASKAGADDSALTSGVEFYGGQKIFDTFKTAAAQVNNDFTWGPTMTDTYRFMADGIANALAGKGTLQDTLKDAQAKTIDSIKAQGLQVVN
ncbi:extracellular solute-binding protein [Nakamurella antarctica]|uniref:Extracellular solute-binding protein n=1 Tax=Nakamurella antarctica TaxID=1902245 RepID=A0A3G8ZNZ6_9ACTN|nr:extracellular solute-binding protein [Nakamurella antarctica]AZI58983.1 extracellular solute-binding protein [Nakamurella antarctica]